MSVERQVKLFRNGRNQAVRIPREFELEGTVALMHREEDRLIIEPLRRRGLLATLAKLPTLEEEFPDVDRGLLPLDSPE
ncbi:MAG: AbrB/MazE/SpoVT family DNA-binding domain-containing protein [Deltaproteobacteria bacterium]|jgi:antitoxin VapB